MKNWIMHKWHAFKSALFHALGRSLQRTKRWDRTP